MCVLSWSPVKAFEIMYLSLPSKLTYSLSLIDISEITENYSNSEIIFSMVNFAQIVEFSEERSG